MATNNYQEEYDDVAVMERPLIDPDFHLRPRKSFDEVWNQFCHKLGERYGLNDIREAK